MTTSEWLSAIRRAHEISGLSGPQAAGAIGISRQLFRLILAGRKPYLELSGRVRRLIHNYFGIEAPMNQGEPREMERDGFRCQIGRRRYRKSDDHECMDELSLAIVRDGLSDAWVALRPERVIWWRRWGSRYHIIATWLDTDGRVDVSLGGRVEVGERGIRWIAD